MSFNAVTLLKSIGGDTTTSFLRKNNVTGTTWWLGTSLTKILQRFYIGAEGMHDGCPIPTEVYPVIFTEIGSTQEIMGRLGNSSNRDLEIELHFVGITQYGAGSNDEALGRENAHLECIQLMSNIQYLLRNNISLSLTVQKCTVENVTYKTNREGVYNVVGNITTKVLITDSD